MTADLRLETARGGALILERSPHGMLSRGWRQALSEASATRTGAEAFVWDDCAIEVASRLRIDPIVVRWPTPDAMLLRQIDQRGRCAIRESALERLFAAGRIAHPRDTHGALAALAEDGARIERVETLKRFVGRTDGPAYAPAFPAPESPTRAAGVSVIINYRDKAALTAEALASLGRQILRCPLEIVLIDNRSQPEERAAVERAASALSPRAAIKHLTFDADYNHSAQNNLGVDEAAHDIVALLNNDAALLDPACLQAMADWAAAPGFLAASPRLIGAGGRLVANGVTIRAGDQGQPAILEENESAALSRVVRLSAGAPFACAAVSRANWVRLGGLDAAAFPTQYNDADFWLRGLAAGLHCLYLGHVVARHEPGQSEARSAAYAEERLAALRARHPDMERFSDIDPRTEPMRETPRFNATADASLLLAQAYSRARGFGAEMKQSLKRNRL